MLVLSRRPGESLVIGESPDIVVTMLEINGKQAKIGVDAPRALGVHRHEVYEKIYQKIVKKAERSACNTSAAPSKTVCHYCSQSL